MYVKVVGGVITVENMPTSARRLDTQEWVIGLRDAPVDLQEACGWFVVVETAPPVVQPDQRATYTIELVSDRPTQVWTVRGETPEELAARTRSANLNTLKDTATVQAKMAELKTFLSDVDVQFLLDIANGTMPTAQQLNRGLKAIIRQLRREANFMMLLGRLELSRFDPSFLDDISDT